MSRVGQWQWGQDFCKVPDGRCGVYADARLTAVIAVVDVVMKEQVGQESDQKEVKSNQIKSNQIKSTVDLVRLLQLDRRHCPEVIKQLKI